MAGQRVVLHVALKRICCGGMAVGGSVLYYLAVQTMGCAVATRNLYQGDVVAFAVMLHPVEYKLMIKQRTLNTRTTLYKVNNGCYKLLVVPPLLSQLSGTPGPGGPRCHNRYSSTGRGLYSCTHKG